MSLERSSVDWGLLPGAVEAALKVRTREQFLEWTGRDLQRLLPHAAISCGAVLAGPAGLRTRPILRAQSTGLEAHDELLRALLQSWWRSQSPQLFEPAPSGSGGNAALHCVPQWASGAAIYFCFSRIPGKLTPQHAKLLNLIVPYMHMALGRTAGFSRPSGEPAGKDEASLTRREGDILELLSKGANNKAIAAGLCLSEHTVRHHLESIYAKLKVRNRAQAVAKTFSSAEAWNA